MNEGARLGRARPARLAGGRRGGDHRPRRPARRARRLPAARLPRLHRRVGRDHPLGQGARHRRHRRGHPAPPAAHRRAGRAATTRSTRSTRRCAPPTTSRRCAQALADGTIDAVATDHAPHAGEDKDCEWAAAAFGHARAARPRCRSWSPTMVGTGLLDWAGVADRHVGRARRASAAWPATAARSRSASRPTWSLVDPDAHVDRRPARARVAAAATPRTRGCELPGRVVATFLRGRPTVLTGRSREPRPAPSPACWAPADGVTAADGPRRLALGRSPIVAVDARPDRRWSLWRRCWRRHARSRRQRQADARTGEVPPRPSARPRRARRAATSRATCARTTGSTASSGHGLRLPGSRAPIAGGAATGCWSTAPGAAPLFVRGRPARRGRDDRRHRAGGLERDGLSSITWDGAARRCPPSASTTGLRLQPDDRSPLMRGASESLIEEDDMTTHARRPRARGRPRLPGDAYGAVGTTFGEAVFSTGMTGYQETLTDPSLPPAGRRADRPAHRQHRHERRGRRVRADLGRRLRRARPLPRRRRTGAPRAPWTTSSRDQGVVGISGIDTRALTRHLRERGAMRVGHLQRPTPRARREELLGAGARPAPAWSGADLAGEVTTDAAVRRARRRASGGSPSPRSTWASRR